MEFHNRIILLLFTRVKKKNYVNFCYFEKNNRYSLKKRHPVEFLNSCLGQEKMIRIFEEGIQIKYILSSY